MRYQSRVWLPRRETHVLTRIVGMPNEHWRFSDSELQEGRGEVVMALTIRREPNR